MRKQLLATIMSGAAVNDPERAIALLGSLPDADRAGMAEKFVGALVQHQGKDRAIEWLASMSAAELESDYGQSLTRSVFDKVMWAGANQSNASVMVADMERLASVVPIDEAWIDRSMGQLRGRKTIGGIELLDQIARSPALSRIPLGESTFSNAVDDALRRDPAAVARWLAANPDSPIHSEVSSMVENHGN
ncbi:MAG TPA: hypothetical protein VLO11_15145 [Luteolibacter sp.]|nr:hypothetical protein [Luteolibacter sp.]